MRFNRRIPFGDEEALSSKLVSKPIFGEDGNAPELRVLEVHHQDDERQEVRDEQLEDPSLANLAHLLQSEADLLGACYPACESPQIPSMVRKPSGKKATWLGWLVAAVCLCSVGAGASLIDFGLQSHAGSELQTVKQVRATDEVIAEKSTLVERPVTRVSRKVPEPVPASQVEHVLELDGSSLEGLMDLEESGCLERAKFSL